jgi:hypothetical protein
VTATNVVGGSVAATTISASGLISINGGFQSSVTAEVTATTYTVLATDVDIMYNAAATTTFTLPAPGAPNVGRYLRIRTYQAQLVNSASANVTKNGAGAGTAILAATVGAWAELKSDGTNWEIITNN